MTARVLVVDDIFPNVKLLEAKLTAEYFDVVTAMNGPDALTICEQGLCDIVLLDVMNAGNGRVRGLPSAEEFSADGASAGGDGDALDQPSDRLRGLDAGADDFLTKPVRRHRPAYARGTAVLWLASRAVTV